ncbi:MAG: amidohydrolase family protein [Actinobacteria bacterium]|nr:amidohydrolase family protein [Actinomycetota bacterium]
MARRSDDDYPGLPIKLNRCSNGEFLPPAPTPVVREAIKRARDDAERHARRLGMSRRQFLMTSMGAATTLLALAACSKEAAQSVGPGATSGGPSGSTGSTPGGTYNVPPEAATDPDAAVAALGGNEFIMDVQTHFLDGNQSIPDLGLSRMFPQQNCADANGDPRNCFTMEKYLDLVYSKSDTNLVVLSALPFAGGPLNPDVMKKTVVAAEAACRDKRLLMQGEAHPSNGGVEGLQANMEQLRANAPVMAWKTYTHAGGPGWWLDDHDAGAPQVGEAFLLKAKELGPNRVCVHKGFGNGSPFADPVDVGPAAARHRDLNFVIYHSGFDVQGSKPEGPYAEGDNWGVNRLITSVKKAGIGPGEHVYAELGSTWRLLMGSPTQAAHVIGKLLVAFGENNVCWGTDSIWYGSPQDQIQAFRTFEISRELQEKFGYPALTPKIKAKIFGLNSSRLYGVDPITTTCRIDPADMEKARTIAYQRSGEGNYTLGPTTPAGVRAVMEHEQAAIGGWL